MLFTLPDPQTLYAALVARDPTYDGRVWVTVASTGIFCKLTCPARKPKRENCAFHGTVAACLDAGFRPCKRCNPLAHPDATITRLITALEADPARRWLERDIAALGLDPSTVRRLFKRQFGMTFLEMARQRRLGEGFTALAGGARMIDAQHAAGFDSATAFRDAFTRLIGRKPGDFAAHARIRIDWINSPLGPLVAACDTTHLHLLEFIDRKALPAEMHKLAALVKGDIGYGRTPISEATEEVLGAYFERKSSPGGVPLALHGTPFTQSVWRALQTIPPGETRSYSQLAAQIGRPDATRAVARANGANQIAILIPCHRVIGADGGLTGYGGGIWRKEKLITLEQQLQRTKT